MIFAFLTVALAGETPRDRFEVWSTEELTRAHYADIRACYADALAGYRGEYAPKASIIFVVDEDGNIERTMLDNWSGVYLQPDSMDCLEAVFRPYHFHADPNGGWIETKVVTFTDAPTIAKR